MSIFHRTQSVWLELGSSETDGEISCQLNTACSSRHQSVGQSVSQSVSQPRLFSSVFSQSSPAGQQGYNASGRLVVNGNTSGSSKLAAAGSPHQASSKRCVNLNALIETNLRDKFLSLTSPRCYSKHVLMTD